tara:strand:+ start:1694 stop:2005 length:312 start_codon:yes stop_codon:yes gene_type:complete
MSLEFCMLDSALLTKSIINNSLKKKCKCCGKIYPINNNDTLIFEQYLKSNTTNITNTLLKNIANDNSGLILDQKCENCKKPFTKLFISDDYTKSFVLCECMFD